MALPLSIPTVTNDDLTAFHHHAFGTAPPPHSLPHFQSTSPVQDNCLNDTLTSPAQFDDDDGDELGYYPNGTKRTLTNQQIAMFRHSEIYAIIRARQLKRENEEFDDGEADPTSATASPSKHVTQAAPEEEEKSVTAGAVGVGEGTSRLKRRKMNRQRNVGDRGDRGGEVPSRREIREMDRPVGGQEAGRELDY